VIAVYQNITGTRIAALTIFTIGAFFRIYFSGLSDSSGADINLTALPYEFADWKGTDAAGLDDKSRDILKLDRYIKRYYKNSAGESVFIYIGYWKKQNGEHQAAKHSPALCLPSNGWLLGKRDIGIIGSAGLDVPIKKLIAEYKGNPHYFHYYFFTGQAYYSQEWRALLNISLQTLFSGRSDGGIVEASAEIRQKTDKQSAETQTDALITKFLQDMNPELRKIIDNPMH
jgi:EpsI family protein